MEGRKRVVTFMARTAVGVSVLYATVYAFVGYTKLIVYSLGFALLYVVVSLERSPLDARRRGVLLIGAGLCHLLGLSVLFATPAAGNHYFLMGIPILAFFVLARRDAAWWWFYSTAACVALTWLEFVRDSFIPIYFPDPPGQDYSAWRAGAALMTLGLIIAIMRKFAEVLAETNRELKDSVAQVGALLVEVEAANAAKSQFLAQMSHDLRTPLNGILGTCEALTESVYGELTSEQLKALKAIERSGQHQLSLVNDLLDLSKIEEGAFEPVRESVSLVSVCRDVVQMLRERAKNAEVKLRLTMDMETDHIISDARRIQQILINLVGNALKFTPAGGAVSLKLDTEGEHVVLSVTDNGIGIAPEDQATLFKAFTQLDSPQQRKHVGSGLGLAITSKLVTLLGGRIDVESAVGQGSTFSVYLPKVLPGGDVEAMATKTPKRIPTVEELKTDVPIEDAEPKTGVHVLIVDDTEANIRHVRDYLVAKGNHVTTAATGFEAIEKARELPDIVFMDVQMPQMDGVEAITRLRADPHTAGLHIVALTSHAMGEDRERCMAAGADGYETKPVSIKKLLAFVEERRGR